MQRQVYELTTASAGPWAVWVDFLAALLGAGGMLLILHLLGVLTLIQRLADLV